MTKESIAPQHILSRFLAFNQSPTQPSFWTPEYGSLSFENLLSKISCSREALRKNGIAQGDHCLLVIHFSLDFLIIIFALLAEGAIPILLDPRLSKKKWRRLAQKAKVKNIITSKQTHLARLFFFPFVNLNFFSTKQLLSTKSDKSSFADLVIKDGSLPILFTFTSGTTGEPKLISRSLEVLGSQQTLFCKYLTHLSGKSHLALHGIGVIQSLIQGSNTFYLPSTKQNPEIIFNLLKSHSISIFSCPPGTLDLLLDYMEREKKHLPDLKFLLTGGAPIPKWMIEKCMKFISLTELILVFGSNECEPISIISFTNNESLTRPYPILNFADYPLQGGYPIGKIVSEMTAQRIPINKVPFFELKLSGPNCVTDSNGYFCSGDLFQEVNGILLFSGRKNDLTSGLPSGIYEDFLERHPKIKRAAVMNSPKQSRVFIELHKGVNWSQANSVTITDYFMTHFKLNIKIVLKEKLPVDRRHQWKIQRQNL